LFEQWAINVGARVTGFIEGGKSLISGISDLVMMSIDINIYTACFLLIDAIKTGDLTTVKAALESILENTEKKAEGLSQAFELLTVILEDEEIRTTLASFPADYINAHSNVEQERFVGILLFEVLFVILTGGAGAAVSVASKSKHAIKAHKALKEIADLVDRKQLNNKAEHQLNKDNQTSSTQVKEPDQLELQGGTNSALALSRRKTPDDFPQFATLNHRKGAAGEYNAHQLMTDKGYKPLGNTDGEYLPGSQGIDGIYRHPNPPPDFVITEAKYNTSPLGKTKDGKQMSNDWVTNKRLKKADLSREEIDQILDGLADKDGSVQKLIIRNKLDNSLEVNVLNENAKSIGKAAGF